MVLRRFKTLDNELMTASWIKCLMFIVFIIIMFFVLYYVLLCLLLFIYLMFTAHAYYTALNRSNGKIVKF